MPMKNTMKYLIIMLSSIIATSASAAMDMKAGLWEVQVDINLNGVRFDPMAAMRTALAAIPESQRKNLEKQMNSTMPNADGRICVNNSKLTDPSALAQEEDCKYKILKNTNKEMSGTATCKEITGTFSLVKKNDNLIVFNISGDREGQKYEMTSTSKFISANCGKIKPIED